MNIGHIDKEIFSVAKHVEASHASFNVNATIRTEKR
jgi:hypothetical protein